MNPHAMSPQTRLSRLVAAAVVAALAVGACGSDAGWEGGAGRTTCSRPVSRGVVTLRYRVESTPGQPGSFEETAAALCARLRKLGLRRVAVAAAGPDLVLHVRRGEEQDARAAAISGALTFFDWDANVLGNRAPDVPFSGRTALFDAVQAASRMSPRAEVTDVPAGSAASPAEADVANDAAPVERHYLFGADRRLQAGPAWSAGALATAPGRKAPGALMLTVPRGIRVVQAEGSQDQPAGAQRYFVVEDDVELTRAGVTAPQAELDQVTHEPVVTMGLSQEGQVAFAALTRRVAERSAAQGGLAGSSPERFGRFAIAWDDRVVSLPAVNPRANPQGLDGRSGIQISGGGTPAQARRTARLLRDPLLPAHLVPLTPDSA